MLSNLVTWWLQFFDFQKKIDWLIDIGGEREREKQVVDPLTDAFTGWFLYVLWPEIKPALLTYLYDASTNWATQTGPVMNSFVSRVFWLFGEG